jgi:hypothetical protein
MTIIITINKNTFQQRGDNYYFTLMKGKLWWIGEELLASVFILTHL